MKPSSPCNVIIMLNKQLKMAGDIKIVSFDKSAFLFFLCGSATYFGTIVVPFFQSMLKSSCPPSSSTL